VQRKQVNWKSCRIIDNAAQRLLDKVKEAVQGFLENTDDKGTVVRWIAAFTLTEIAKSSKDVRKRLVTEFKKMPEREDKSGVGNILKYLKT